ncbi:FkbM family methyltransferase [Falsiroseomonas sp. HW251]|uniref:FkbM family methyltransferase n=1 Tax=Falsiroseomonas sp. HW251 TaxID=3390998 RepID=UPI003D32030B
MLKTLRRLSRRSARALGEWLISAAGPASPTEVTLRGMSSRQEAIFAYLYQRTHTHYHSMAVPVGENTVLALLHARLMIYLDTRGRDLAPHVMMFGIWEPPYTQLFQRLIRPGDTVFDIGAHHGVYTLLGAVATGHGGKVHAFEPNPRYAELLDRSIAVNGFGGICQLHPVAVGAAEGQTELHFSFEYGGGGHLALAGYPLRGEKQGSACRVVALDDLFPDPATTVDVMKMDVEGTETNAVRGMRGLLARSPRARVMFEFAPQLLTAHGGGPAALIEEFRTLGFRFWSIEEQGGIRPADEAELAARRTGLANILAAREDPFAG